MEAVLYRTGSGTIQAKLPQVPGSPRVANSPSNISLHMELGRGRRTIRRSSSESDIIRSDSSLLTRHRSRSFHELPAVILEEEDDFGGAVGTGRSGFSWGEASFPGGGMNNNRKSGGGGGGGDSSGDRCDIGAYYEKMLKSDPMNALLLTNYGKYLHEVEENYVKAEECYGRAILASPGDGELLSLYGKLIWESQRDESRAKSYFKQAVQVAPENCSVLGSYAHFMWEVEDDDEEEDEEELRSSTMGVVSMNPSMVEAF